MNEFLELGNELGRVIGTMWNGKKCTIVREFGIERFHSALDPMRVKIEILYKSPRRIYNVKQIEHLLKRRKRP